MDCIESINFKTDSTISIAKSLQSKSTVKLIDPDSVYMESNCVYGTVNDIYISSLNKREYKLHKKKKINLNQLDCIFLIFK